jgi:hypothetical protein
MKRPAFQFYPADWRKDMALQSCSIGSRGLWMEMMCIAHECEPYGHLTVNGRAMTCGQIARHTGLHETECAAFLDELEQSGVFSRSEDGAIFSRRMVADEELRKIRAEGGKSGAEHGHKGATHGHKGGRPQSLEGGKKPPLPDTKEPPLEPPPSSSSSSSSSVEVSVAKATSSAETTADAGQGIASCPADRLIEIYHEVLPELPRVRLKTAGRSKALSKVWRWVLTSKRPDGSRRAETAEQALQWFRGYFEQARDNAFLMGRTPRTDAHANWRPDIDYLMTERGMRMVIERTYLNEGEQ